MTEEEEPRKKARSLLLSVSGEEYELGKILGSGVTAHVYRCTNSPTLCIKRVHEKDAQKGETLESERRFLRRVHGHRNVISVLDHSACETWYVMHVASNSLDKHIKSRNMAPFAFRRGAQIKGLWVQLLSALAHCHRAHVIHRDVKPQNILVDSHGLLKLSDFGLAACVSKTSKRRSVRKGNGEYCTIWYRAPELLIPLDSYGCAADVWSAGCVLAEMLFSGNALFPCVEVNVPRKQLHMIWGLRGTPDDDARPKVKGALRVFGKSVSASHFRATIGARNNKSTFGELFTDSLMDTLERALELNDSRRATAEQLLQMAWIQSVAPSPQFPPH